MSNESLTALAAKLASGTDSSLTIGEKQAIIAALSALVSSQGVISRQARLLKSYQHDVDSIDAGTSAALNRLSAMLSGSPASAPYDLAKSRAARETLLSEIERAESLEGVLARILNFAKQVAVIAA